MASRPPDSTRRAASPLEAGGEFALLVPTGGAFTSVALPSRGILTVGRGDDAEIVIADDSISRRHARIHCGQPPRVEDLESKNGTRVMGKVLAKGDLVALDVGTIVEFGTVAVLVRRSLGEAERASTAAPLRPTTAHANAKGAPRRDVVLKDPTMQQLYKLIDVIAPSMLPVLILGETGVGKDVYAETVHATSARAAAPFLRLNCAALSESLLESELFGHEKGAFTGAVQAKAGLFESADGGTVFLDEVGELSPATQAKLLRVLENGEVIRVGSLKTKHIDVRFVCATNRDLEILVSEGRFRSDLFFRLNGVAVTLPPLRQRPADIDALASHFVAAAAARSSSNKKIASISDAALVRLRSHRWPGNIRELRNVVERAVLMGQGPRLEAEDFAFHAGLGIQGAHAAPPSLPASHDGERVYDEMKRIERDRILAALEAHGGNQSRAAEALGIPRRTFVKRLDEYGIVRPRKS